jgi:hypothetical protein
MRRSMGRALAPLALLVSIALPAQAQTRHIFVGAGVIADSDRTNSRLTDDVAPSGTLVLGLDVRNHLGVRITFDTPRQSHMVAENVFRPTPLELPSRVKVTRTQRSMTYALLADVHRDLGRRARLAMTFGLARVTHESETIVVREDLRPDGSTSPFPDARQTGDYPWLGLPIGLEVPLLLGHRLEIVPELRAIYFFPSDSPSPYIIRSGVGFRWRL